MALPSFARQTVTIIRPGSITDHGTQVPDWSAPTLIPVPGCSVQPATGARNYDHRDAVRADLAVWMPPGTDARGTDHVRVPGYPRDFEVTGQPGLWASPTGSAAHVVVNLTVWEG